MIGIIGAMETEVKSLLSSMKDAKEIQIGNLTFYSGRLIGKDVVIVKCGVGKVNASVCASTLIREFEPDAIINTGIAGAMAAGLRMFDFVVSSEAIYHDVDIQVFGYKLGQIPGAPVSFKADEKLISAVEMAFVENSELSERKLVKGRVATGDQFISTKEKKDFIKTNFLPACTEMEGAAIAHTCTNFGIPFVIVRCMSDMADESAEQTYQFNEDTAAEQCAKLIKSVLGEI
ncbi:MAG: 5'-methylthioadenosine/adenosylhomocysteine nucleosidase [Treponema sp.]|nr:5'-methylthioadenosine/adenosylhomocysteine nucleosidase [Treponema sp.]